MPRFLTRAIRLESLDRLGDFGIGQHHRGADLQRDRILAAQGLDFDGEPHRLRQVRTRGDHAVVGKQAGAAAFEGVEGEIREALRAVGSVGRAADGRSCRMQ